MPIEVLPQPSAPTAPQMTPDSRAEDKALGVSPPGAGGWTPAPRTLFLLSGVPAALTGLGASIAGLGMGTPYQMKGLIAAAVLVSGAQYVSTLIGGRSAGPRKLTE